MLPYSLLSRFLFSRLIAESQDLLALFLPLRSQSLKLILRLIQFSSVQFSRSIVSNSLRPHGLQHAGILCPSPTPRAYSTHVRWIGDAIQPSPPLLSPSPPAFNLSRIRVFSSESVLCIRWPKYWSFSFSISPSNEYSGLISFRMNWSDLLAIQETLKSLLQYHTQVRLMTPNKYPTQASLLCEPCFVTHCPLGITTGASKRVNIPVQAAVQSEIQSLAIPCLPSLPLLLSPHPSFQPKSLPLFWSPSFFHLDLVRRFCWLSIYNFSSISDHFSQMSPSHQLV